MKNISEQIFDYTTKMDKRGMYWLNGTPLQWGHSPGGLNARIPATMKKQYRYIEIKFVERKEVGQSGLEFVSEPKINDFDAGFLTAMIEADEKAQEFLQWYAEFEQSPAKAWMNANEGKGLVIVPIEQTIDINGDDNQRWDICLDYIGEQGYSLEVHPETNTYHIICDLGNEWFDQFGRLYRHWKYSALDDKDIYYSFTTRAREISIKHDTNTGLIEGIYGIDDEDISCLVFEDDYDINEFEKTNRAEWIHYRKVWTQYIIDNEDDEGGTIIDYDSKEEKDRQDLIRQSWMDALDEMKGNLFTDWHKVVDKKIKGGVL